VSGFEERFSSLGSMKEAGFGGLGPPCDVGTTAVWTCAVLLKGWEGFGAADCGKINDGANCTFDIASGEGCVDGR
jgi:hypothetical protein